MGKTIRLLAVVLALTFIASLSTLAAPKTRYRAVELGTLGLDSADRTYSRAMAISDSGMVVGDSDGKPFRWTKRTGMVELPGLKPGGGGMCQAVNNRGEAAGWAWDSNGASHAVIWNRRGRIIDVGMMPGDFMSVVHGMNDRGEAVGLSWGDVMHAFYWSPKTGMVLLPTLGGMNAIAFDIANDGTIVGVSMTEDGYVSEACIWRPGEPPMAIEANWALAINNSGMAAGSGADLACVWTADAGTRWLDNYRDGFCGAQDISESGMVAGVNMVTNEDRRAVVWDRSGRLTDLGLLPDDTSSEAYGINNRGTVVGYSTHILVDTQISRAVMWEPVSRREKNK